ncbi:MAG: signal peptidase II [Proteobacteria bacterium]|nr:signal peptidase II [Pseudomonadota bacterium]
MTIYPKIALITLIAIATDQISKWYVVWYLDLLTLRQMDVAPPFLTFRMAWNQGINFGLFAGGQGAGRAILIILALAICLILLVWARRFHGWMAAIFIGLVIGGALGNVFDRLYHGAVVDFLNMSCCGINNPFSFNIADVWVFAGAFGLILFEKRLKRQ